MTREIGMNRGFLNALFLTAVVAASLSLVPICASAQEKSSGQEKKGQLSTPGYAHTENLQSLSPDGGTDAAACGRAS